MDFGFRRFTGWGRIIEEPSFAVTSQQKEVCTLRMAFAAKDTPETCFELKTFEKQAVRAKSFKVGEYYFVEGVIYRSEIDNDNPYGCGNVGLMGKRLFKTEPTDDLFMKVVIFGVVSKEPEVIPIQGKSESITKVLTRVNYASVKNGERTDDTHFFELVGFGKTGDSAQKKLANGDHAYFECSFKRRIKSSGVYPDLVFNFFRS